MHKEAKQATLRFVVQFSYLVYCAFVWSVHSVIAAGVFTTAHNQCKELIVFMPVRL